MVIFIAVGGTLDEIQHPFMIKTLIKVCREGTYLNITKAIYDKSIANMILNGEKWEVFPINPRTRQDGHSHHCFNTVLEVRVKAIRHTRKRNKMYPNWKGRGKTASIYADDMILHTENPEDSRDKLLKLIHEFSKVSCCGC